MERDDTIRQLHELALRCGRNRQSKQTGYIHLCYHPDEDDKHDTIPVVENFLFALALLQSRTTEHIIEARTLLEKLLHFQTADGNFPVYIHEYPHCRDRFLGTHILPAFYWIHKTFSSVLGSDFLLKFTQATQSLLRYNLKMDKQAPYHLAIKLAACANGFANLWKTEATSVEAPRETSAWYCPSSIGDILTGLQIVYPSLSNTPWNPFWQHLISTWHEPSGTYSGPPLREFQQGFEPQATLYDLYLGYFSGHISERALIDNPFHLYAALIAPTNERIPSTSTQATGKIEDCQWQIQRNNGYIFTLLEQQEPGRLCPDRGRHIFRLSWGNRKRVHTLVCQGGNSSHTTFKTSNNIIELFFELKDVIPSEDREKNREIQFFFDMTENPEIIIQDVAATTFQLGDVVTIRSAGLQFTMQFTLEHGQGQFFGHLMPGNRPAQLPLKGPQKFNAYDWQLFLRTVRRDVPCRIKLRMEIQ